MSLTLPRYQGIEPAGSSYFGIPTALTNELRPPSLLSEGVISDCSVAPCASREKWNGKPRLACVNVRHPPPTNPIGVLVLDIPESKEMTEQIDWREKQPSQAG